MEQEATQLAPAGPVAIDAGDAAAPLRGLAPPHVAASSSVSSLLPQVPTSALFPSASPPPAPQQPSSSAVNQAIQQARYAMLLQAAGTLEQQAAAASNPLASLATLTQHLAGQSAAGGGGFPGAPSVAASISSASTPAASLSSAAQLLATHSAAVSALASHHQQQHHHHHHQHVHNQTLATLENQVALLRQLKQPVPQALALLLADARRREEKKHAKRVANRRSASTSRARKKALVQEMTDLNARLRRQALILSLLPDLVIVTDADGVVSFCSEQVERVLRHPSAAIVGSPIEALLAPSSRDKMKKLLKGLVAAEAAGATDDTGAVTASGCANAPSKEKRQQVSEDASEEPLDGMKKAKLSGIPLTVVEVDAGRRVGKADETDNSDASRDSNKLASSLTGSSATAPRSPHPSDSDDNKKSKETSKDRSAKASDKESGGSDDNSHASSLSIEGDAAQDAAARKLQSANANLERNVRWHNKNLKAGGRGDAAEFKDDVIGATVTANNASARLSSLRVQESEVSSKDDKNPSSEEDSGYRESSDSREETSSSTFSDSSSKGGRRKPLAPTCNVCLIRDDLSTIWCEVTSSIRTRYVKQEEAATEGRPDEPKGKAGTSSNASESDAGQETVKEIYLCLRPIRAGRHSVEEKYRFPRADGGLKAVSDGSKTGQSSGEGDSSKSSSDGIVASSEEKASSLDSSSMPQKKRSRLENSVEDMDDGDEAKKAKIEQVSG